MFALLQQNQDGVGHYGTVGEDVDGVIPPVPERTSGNTDEESGDDEAAGDPTSDPTGDPTGQSTGDAAESGGDG